MVGNAIANTFQQYSDAGVREDLGDVIFNVAPYETPFVSKIGKTVAKQSNHEWLVDDLGSIDSSNAHVLGDDIVSFDATVSPVRRGNRVQLSYRTAIIADDEELADKAGRKSMVAYTVAKLGKKLKLDISAIVLKNQAKVAPSSGVAPKTAGYQSWCFTNVSHDGGVLPTGDGTDPYTPGASRILTEDLAVDVLESVFTHSGEQPDIMLVPPSLKHKVSGFPGNATRMIDAETKKIASSVRIYESEWGDLMVMPDRTMPTDAVFCVNSDYWKMAWFKPITVTELAKTGLATKRLLWAEYALEASNEAASGVIADVA